MIDEVHIRNVALIHDAELVPAPGLTVVTGESGSGKSALLSGLKLLLGERGGADLVREGASSLSVEGRFFYGGSAGAAGDSCAADAAAAGEDGLVVRRTISAEGRSRVQIDGCLGTVRDLSEGPGRHVDLCGQHEHQRLLKPAEQAAMLEAWAGAPVLDARAAYRAAFAEIRACEREYDRVQELGRSDAARVENARFVLRSIDAVGPRAGEYEELLAEAERIEHAESIAVALEGANRALSGEGAVLEQLGDAITGLEDVGRFDGRYAELAQTLRETQYLLEDAAREASSLREDDESFDPDALERLQERVAAYQGLMRTYGPTVDAVLAARSDAEEIVASVDCLDERLAEAQENLARAEAALVAAAEVYRAALAKAAPLFAEEVGACLAELEMSGVEFICRMDPLERADWTASSPAHVEFLFRPGPGMSERPLRRIASGGEISRVMLAVKVALGETDGVETLVFDEVDAGVGGKAARAVAAVLKRLAQSHQVICVTHLPQIAVAGEAHFVIRRARGESDDVPPRADLCAVEGSMRVDEVARMLSGSIDASSRAHAATMLDQEGR